MFTVILKNNTHLYIYVHFHELSSDPWVATDKMVDLGQSAWRLLVIATFLLYFLSKLVFLLSNFIKFSLLHKVIYKFYTFQDVTWNFWLFLLQDHLKFHTRPDPDVLSLLPHSLKESNEKRLFVENNFPASISTRAFQAFSLRSEKLYKNKFNHFPFIFMFKKNVFVSVDLFIRFSCLWKRKRKKFRFLLSRVGCNQLILIAIHCELRREYK